MMHIVSVDHSLQIPAPFDDTPSDPLMNDNIMKNEIEKTVQENTQTYREHIWIITNK